MSEKNYIKGLRLFPNSETTPEFIVANGVIDIKELEKYIEENQDYLTEYNGKPQMRFQIQKTTNGSLTFVLNTYKK
jgi:hypothetical protein